MRPSELAMILSSSTETPKDFESGTQVSSTSSTFTEDSDTCFLLLDVRSFDDFQDCHIQEAISFPEINLRQDKILPELFR